MSYCVQKLPRGTLKDDQWTTSLQLSIRRIVVKELLNGINVPLGTFDAQYDIEKTLTWLLGGQRIFLRKSSYLRTPPFHTSHPIKFDMKMEFFFCDLPANRPYLPANR